VETKPISEQAQTEQTQSEHWALPGNLALGLAGSTRSSAGARSRCHHLVVTIALTNLGPIHGGMSFSTREGQAAWSKKATSASQCLKFEAEWCLAHARRAVLSLLELAGARNDSLQLATDQGCTSLAREEEDATQLRVDDDFVARLRALINSHHVMA
jgi:hypothetical protein